MLNMKVAPNDLLKTKGQKKCSNELMKIKKLPNIRGDLLKGKELDTIGSSDHRAIGSFERLAIAISELFLWKG